MALAAKQTAAAVKREIQALRDPARASFLQKYFRTGVGEYGEGDRFLGLTVPQQRLIARAFRQLPLAEMEILLASPFHEHRSVALMVLAAQHDRADEKEKLTLHRFYLDHIAAVNNWDLVDGSTASLVGQHIAGNAALMRKLVKSENVWHRRIAIVSTFAEIRAGRTAVTFAMAERLLSDKHDLIHKAVGWLLREAGKLSQDELLEFLRKNYGRLPRTTLRYAIERFDPIDRKSWSSGPK